MAKVELVTQIPGTSAPPLLNFTFSSSLVDAQPSAANLLLYFRISWFGIQVESLGHWVEGGVFAGFRKLFRELFAVFAFDTLHAFLPFSFYFLFFDSELPCQKGTWIFTICRMKRGIDNVPQPRIKIAFCVKYLRRL